MRINLSVSAEEFEMLKRAADYQAKVVPGADPKITGVAKSCMLSGLRETLQMADNLEAMEKAKKKK